MTLQPSKVFVEFSKDFVGRKSNGALNCDCLYTFFVNILKQRGNVGYLICKIIFCSFSFALFELGQHHHKKASFSVLPVTCKFQLDCLEKKGKLQDAS